MTISSFPIIDHRRGENSRRLIRRIEGLFARHEAEFRRARELARETAVMIGRLDPVIERHTVSVCPQCMSVCCANRHSYHTHEDVIYLCALGEKVPPYDLRIADEAPCQFIGLQGCSISRALRPHRCNSYFCTPLLEHMENSDAREYRRFAESLKELTRTRMDMLQAFAEAAAALAAKEE
jgi:hypothetical protein